MPSLDDITGTIIDAALKIHRDLGPGLLESVYEVVLAHALARRGLQVERQKVVGIEYEGVVLDAGFRIDLLVQRLVIVEVKSLEKLAPVYTRQLNTYLRLTGLHVGLLLDFGAPTLRDGLRRVVNGLPPSASPRLRVNRPSPRRTRPTEGSGRSTDGSPARSEPPRQG